MPALETVRVYLKSDPQVSRVINVVDFDASIYQYEQEIERVSIIDPNHGNRRLEIPRSEYDPEMHRLWETHRKFRRQQHGNSD